MPKLIESLNNLILSESFCSRHRQKPNDFVRTRILPFHALICFFLNMNNGSYQTESDRYFKVVNHLEVEERFLYKGNLTKARAN